MAMKNRAEYRIICLSLNSPEFFLRMLSEAELGRCQHRLWPLSKKSGKSPHVCDSLLIVDQIFPLHKNKVIKTEKRKTDFQYFLAKNFYQRNFSNDTLQKHSMTSERLIMQTGCSRERISSPKRSQNFDENSFFPRRKASSTKKKAWSGFLRIHWTTVRTSAT